MQMLQSKWQWIVFHGLIVKSLMIEDCLKGNKQNEKLWYGPAPARGNAFYEKAVQKKNM